MKKQNYFAWLCYGLLFLASAKSTAQETFTLSLEDSKQLSQTVKHYRIHSVSQREVETNKNTYFVDDKLVDGKTFAGTFTKLPQEYILVRKEVEGMFLKDELVTDLKGQYNEGYDESFPLIQNNESKQLYFVPSNEFVPEAMVVSDRHKILESLHKMGYQEYEKSDGKYIKSKTAEIRLDTWTFDELKNNPSYIAMLDRDQTKITALVKQTPSHTKALDKYINLYNIKGSKMSKVDISAWRIETANAQKLHAQIYKLSKKYEGNYSFTLLDKSDALEVFLNNLRASKGILNM